ncbi:MAG: BatA domain-containing protein, partial [Anaerolineales bacterium]
MSFLAPLALLLGLLAVPVLILYMLKLRRREVEVSS